MKKFLLVFIFSSLCIQAQESIQAKLLDSISKEPIPYATISINENSGVISNENGDFSIYLTEKTSKTDSLKIRSLGYETKQFLIEAFQDSIVFLNQTSIELDEVMVSNKNYSTEEIIEKINENLEENYNRTPIKSRLFYRSSNFNRVTKSDVDIKKTSIPELNQQFIDSVVTAMPKEADDHTEILADIYGKSGLEDSQKLDIIKASHLYDKSNEVTFEFYEEKFNNIIKKHVKRDSYFKIKSGFFGTKQDIDSTFFNELDNDKGSQTEAMLEAEKKKEKERKADFLKYRKSAISDIQNNSFVFEDSDFNFLEKSNRYEFKLEDYSFLNDEFVYKISFKPKRSEDYKGVIYVSTDDFAIIRLDYENVNPLKKFSMFGVSYKHYHKKGTIIYAKNSLGTYDLRYADVENGTIFEIERPLKIIEKNKNTRGRRKQNELSSDIHFKVGNTEKNELIVFENEVISEAEFDAFTEKPDVKPVYLPKYDPEFWKGYNVIEPNQAIKDFKSLE
ncbi:carboxypeptidase-like regulatory domain-containing protein [Tamlana sp. 2_MG-2023]|uniref:carboxypeptidase-like regulatory domain-containing protein n=1 Tax=unclassified Tamlana TaxID=2614803 RepID=UPI0026E240D1|nr:MULTISPECIES: carboxypeptidase-like regulatory domain-containing protein [unclassified Tamlana]MDO6760926.1 carboxypeptidase-like regulatory domain-containing protein [Tamlana sp. 2_MG-2023]MDO6791182.1 carboxypeptidase-like regulatory domain-containing protein [Tamlana sp. 1_MG-2023]